MAFTAFLPIPRGPLVTWVTDAFVWKRTDGVGATEGKNGGEPAEVGREGSRLCFVPHIRDGSMGMGTAPNQTARCTGDC